MRAARIERLALIEADAEEDSPRTVQVEYRPLTGRGSGQGKMCYFALICDGERVGTLTEKCAPSRVRISSLRRGAARILGAADARPIATAVAA